MNVTCSSTANPPPTWTWTFNDTTILENVTVPSLSSTLSLTMITAYLSGQFTCTAVNNATAVDLMTNETGVYSSAVLTVNSKFFSSDQFPFTVCPFPLLGLTHSLPCCRISAILFIFPPHLFPCLTLRRFPSLAFLPPSISHFTCFSHPPCLPHFFASVSLSAFLCVSGSFFLFHSLSFSLSLSLSLSLSTVLRFPFQPCQGYQ